jgi:signal transduction histidine kinase
MKFRLFLVFVIVVGFAYLVLHAEKSYKTEKYIANKSKEHKAMYNAVYHSFKKRADLAYSLILNNHSIQNIYRKLQTTNLKEVSALQSELQNAFKKEYKLLKNEGVDNLHFHTKDNYSFLRFHNLKRNGDDLSKIRKTVVHVNKFKKPVHGFEVGRFHNGYRFVYPLFDLTNGNHLGSVEISFGLKYFVMEFIETLDVLSNFRIKKEIVDRKYDKDSIEKLYKVGRIENYYSQKDILSLIHKDKRTKIKTLKADIKTIENGVSHVEKGNTISLFDYKSRTLITFIPVFNNVTKEVCGFTTIRSNDKYIYNKRINTFFILLLIAFISLFSLYYIYRKSTQHKEIQELLQNEVDKKTKELQDINNNLEEKVKEEVDKNIKHELKIYEQSKLAGLGDMIGNIVHQWRQPLSSMSALTSALLYKNELKILKEDDMNNDLEKVLVKIQYLSETIETFRNYLKEEKVKRTVVLQDRIELSASITEISLKDNHIDLIKNYKSVEPIKVSIVIGELSQVIINIINNAKDALIEKKVKEPWINISLETTDKTAIVTIEDNAGGIPEHVMPKIFDQYFTTKDESIGTGLGLHMSYKIITDSLDGKLYVKNSQNGAKFFIELPIAS